jgi:mannose-1-phosphate guanylyltransferase
MFAVILAGGSGTRLRPLRAADDSAFALMADGRSLLQQTVKRLAPLVDPPDIVVVANRRHGQLVREQVPEARIVIQPMNRGTATALALALVSVDRPEWAPMVVVAADHEVEREDVMREQIALAGEQAVGGALGVEMPLVTFGIRPTIADPELTYVEPSYDEEMRVGGHRVYRVRSVEPKPEPTRTRQLFESGTRYWNAGIYVATPTSLYGCIQRYTPLLTMLGPAYRSELALNAAYDRLQPVSIEEGVLVGAARDGIVLTMPLDVGVREVALA